MRSAWCPSTCLCRPGAGLGAGVAKVYGLRRRHVTASPRDEASTSTASGTPVSDPDASRKDLGVGMKAAWYGAELFGKLGAGGKASADTSGGDIQALPGLSQEAVIASIREDYQEDYFISGRGAMAAYDPSCLFSDDFASFRGVERFKANVANLGALLSEVSLELTSWEEREGEVEVGWRFSGILALPWRPRLAAAGSTTHVIRDGRVIQHIERWKSDPKKVVAALLRPAARVPTSRAEAVMLALSSGDVAGVWLGVSDRLGLACLGLCAASAALRAATGEGLPVDGLLWLVVASSGATELWKIARGFSG